MNEAPAAPRPAPGKRISFALAVLMHLLLVLLLVYGVHWQTQKPKAVEVDLVRAVPPAPTSAPEPKPAPKPEPKPELPPPKPEPKPDPVKPPPKPDIAQKEKPKATPVTPKPEPKPDPAKPTNDPFKEQLDRELQDNEKRKSVAAADKDMADLKAKQASAALASEVDKYIAALRGKVRGNIILPPDLKGNPEAVFEVTQLPSGDVIAVKLKKTSGSPGWDDATERAIKKSSPLPKPAKSELFSRSLELKFRPQDD